MPGRPAAKSLTWEDTRAMLQMIATKAKIKEYSGLPAPIPGVSLILEPTHTARDLYYQLGQGGRPKDTREITNSFFSNKLKAMVFIWKADGWTKQHPKIEWGIIPSANHVYQDLTTMGCHIAWSIDAEIKAMKKLSTLIPKHLYEMYFLTGMFLETSKRSGITYVFRRLKPTIALRAKGQIVDTQILCSLCLHPIGYYEDTWAGAMVPTDDVMAHLLMMRSDEPYYWRKANQILPHHSEAGL